MAPIAEYVSHIGDVRLSVTSSGTTLDVFESESVPWGTVSPALFSESRLDGAVFDLNERPSFGDVRFEPVASKAYEDLSLLGLAELQHPPIK